MAQHSANITFPHVRAASRAWLLTLSYVVVALVAALPRLLALGVFVTVDETSFWIHRSAAFMDALKQGNFGATAIAPHPGVTTMWLGGIGQIVYNALLQRGILSDTSFQAYLAWQQLPVALVHTLGVVAGYALLRRLFTPITALLAALLWAADPFVVGFSRVLHVDMLAGTFLTLGVLMACVYWHHDRQWRWLVGSGVCAGLAMLSKLPGIAIVPVVIMVALWAAWRPVLPGPASSDSARRGWWRTVLAVSIRPLALWSAVLVLTLLIFWPAIWAAPASVYDLLRFGVVNQGGEPHEQGNFFLGQPIDAPGIFFYPVTLALRTTPLTLLGLLALPFVFWLWPRVMRRNMTVLVVVVLLFTAALSLSPKKFNRYLVPAFPAVDMLAAAGLMGLAQGAERLVQSKAARRAVAAGVFTTATLAATANVAFWHPYGMDAYNQVLGGTLAGANTFLTGWGEGLNETAAWLNEQPDITGVTVATTLVDPLQRYLRPGAQAYTPSAAFTRETGYVVVYIRSVQDRIIPPPFDQFYGRVTPLHVTTIHGTPYAWIYQMPPTVAQPRAANFGTALRFYGFDGNVDARAGGQLQLKLWWKTQQQLPTDYRLFAHLLRSDGTIMAQVDLPYATRNWAPQRFLAQELLLPLPADLPPGTYQLAVGLYDPATGQRLPLEVSNPSDRAPDGEHALLLTDIQVQ